MKYLKSMLLPIIACLFVFAASGCTSCQEEVTEEPIGEAAAPTDNYADAMIDADTFYELMITYGDYIVVDVRQYHEFISRDMGHVPGSRNIPLEELNTRWTELAPYKDRIIYLISTGGEKALIARSMLLEKGFQRVAVIEGGMYAWQSAGFETVTTP